MDPVVKPGDLLVFNEAKFSMLEVLVIVAFKQDSLYSCRWVWFQGSPGYNGHDDAAIVQLYDREIRRLLEQRILYRVVLS